MANVYRNKQPQVMEHETKQMDWWMRHHKQNVQFFCIRIANMLKAREDGDTEGFEWHLRHFKAVLPAFADSVQFDLMWEDEGSEEE